MKIRVLVTGRSYHSAGPLPDEIELPAGHGVDDALQALSKMLPADQPLPTSCLVAVSGEHLGTIAQHRNRELQNGDELILLAPVAGG